ncbi:hypothetical protein Bbelb_265330 [Branchiostoma belcheri]|nr:hypothetical protein Bbelb_265330 [Branchiostoma belcheri]
MPKIGKEACCLARTWMADKYEERGEETTANVTRLHIPADVYRLMELDNFQRPLPKRVQFTVLYEQCGGFFSVRGASYLSEVRKVVQSAFPKGTRSVALGRIRTQDLLDLSRTL